MMITIHGFPAKTKYQDVKLLIKQECSINDFILDNLISDTDGTKKVRIGLTDNTEGYKVMKCLDGYRMPGNFVLKAIPVGKTTSNLPSQASGFDSRPNYDYANAPRNDYMSQPNDYNNQGSHGTGPPLSHGPMGSHAPRPSQGGPHSGPHVSGGPQGPIDSMNRPSPWAGGGGNSNQWGTPMAAQVPQHTFGYTASQPNVHPPYGQQQSHPRPGFNQGRPADQGYGYTPKNGPDHVPANSRYRWDRKAEQETDVPKTTGNDEGSTEGPLTDDIFDEKSQDVIDDSEKQTSEQLGTSDTNFGTKYIRLDKKRQREINRLKTTKRRRFFFWMKQGKSFEEARELCENVLKKVSEFAVVKAEMKKRARENEIRCMSPERQARAIKLERLKGRGIPGTPAQPRPKCNAIWVRLFDELGRMPIEKIEMLEDKVLELMDAETDGNGPSFLGYRKPSGSLVLSCENAQTVEWLENHLTDFQLWEGAQIKISNVADEPKRVIAVACIPEPCLDEEEIIECLQSHNEGIDFSDWSITHMKPEYQAQTVTFSVVNFPFDKLAETNNYVYFGPKKIKIRCKTKLREKQETKGEMDTPPEEPSGMASVDQAGLPPEGPSGMASMDQTSTPSKGQQGMPPKGQRGMAPKGQRGMPSKGQRGMAPKGQRGMPFKGQRGIASKGQRGMPFKGQRGMASMGQRGMPPGSNRGMRWNMGHMRPMDTEYMGPMYMGTMASVEPIDFIPAGSSQRPGFSQSRYFRGGNQHKHFRGGKNHNKNKKRGG